MPLLFAPTSLCVPLNMGNAISFPGIDTLSSSGALGTDAFLCQLSQSIAVACGPCLIRPKLHARTYV